jgi:hypothetical protein
MVSLQVLSRSQLIFPSKTWFFGIYLVAETNISHILNPNLTNQIQLNLGHQDLSNNTKGTFQSSKNFSYNLI